METKNKLFWVFLITILIVLIYIITVNYDVVNSFIEANIGAYGYPAIFVFSFLCDSIDQPMVPEVPSILGIVYGLDVFIVFLVAVAGISLIGLINFNIGKKVFRPKIQILCTTKKYSNYCRLFYKYGKLSLLLAALTSLPYVTFVWLSGAFDMRFRDFFVFGMLAKVLRLGFFLLLSVFIFG